jgi:hypothetical protein
VLYASLNRTAFFLPNVCGFASVFLFDRGNVHAPSQVDDLEFDAPFFQFFFYHRENDLFQVVALRLHIGKGAADKDGEGAPGGGYLYLWRAGIRLFSFWFFLFLFSPGTRGLELASGLEFRFR